MNIFLWFEWRGSQTNGILAGFIVYSETGCKSGYLLRPPSIPPAPWYTMWPGTACKHHGI